MLVLSVATAKNILEAKVGTSNHPAHFLCQPTCLVGPGTTALFMPATSALVLLKWIFAFRNLLLIDIYIQNPIQALLIEENEQLTKSPVFVEENKSFKFN
jgi:hypothetical protein